jgi:hypothetical protein
MSGEIAIRQLLVGAGAVTVIVPPDTEISRMVVGVLAKGVDLPALAIQTTRSEERKTVRPGPTRQVTDQVRVTPLVETYDELAPLMKAVRAACSHQFPAVEGIDRVVSLFRSEGELFVDEETAIHMKPQDFTVTYSEAR